MWQIILWSIGAFYALLIVPLLAYALYWFVREIPSFLKQRSLWTSASKSASQQQQHPFNGMGTNNLTPSNQQTSKNGLNQSPRTNLVNTPKRIHIQSIITASSSAAPSPMASPSLLPVPPLSPSSSSSISPFSSSSSSSVSTPNERIIRVQPSQSNLHGSIIHPLDNSSPFPSFSKLPGMEPTRTREDSTQSSAPPSPPTSTMLHPAASIDMLSTGTDYSSDEDAEIRALEAYFTRSTTAPLSIDSVFAMGKPGFQRVASSELHARVVIPVQDSAPPTPDTLSLRQNPYSKEFESGALPTAVVTSNVALSPKSHSIYSSSPSSSHASQAALLIAKRATTSQFRSGPFPYSSAHADTPSNFSVRAVA